MATREFSSAEVPHTLVLNVPVPKQLSNKNIESIVNVAAAHLRFKLSEQYKAQRCERVKARVAAEELRRACG